MEGDAILCKLDPVTAMSITRSLYRGMAMKYMLTLLSMLAAVSSVVAGEATHSTDGILRVSENLSEKMYPIALKCPEYNEGTMELISSNRSLLLSRVRAFIVGNRVAVVSYAVKENAADFRTKFKWDFSDGAANDAFNYDNAKNIEKTVRILKRDVCDASDAAQKHNYGATLKSNAEALGLSTDEYPILLGN